MSPLMFSKSALLGKASIADLTDKRFFTSMCPHMVTQNTRCCEYLIAEGAPVLCWAFMNSKSMASEIRYTYKLAVTFLAFEFFNAWRWVFHAVLYMSCTTLQVVVFSSAIRAFVLASYRRKRETHENFKIENKLTKRRANSPKLNSVSRQGDRLECTKIRETFSCFQYWQLLWRNTLLMVPQ